MNFHLLCRPGKQYEGGRGLRMPVMEMRESMTPVVAESVVLLAVATLVGICAQAGVSLVVE